MHPLEEPLLRRAAAAGLTVPVQLRSRLLAYYDLLLRWNSKINLTALTDQDEGIDRLLLEPLAAAQFLPQGARLIDLGSGGGSPAIPLALALKCDELVMVESKARKASFLREAVRHTRLNATVETARFEDLAALPAAGAFDVVSMRAVRMDAGSLTAAARFLRVGGELALFVSRGTALAFPPVLRLKKRHTLLNATALLRIESTFHVEH